MVQKLTPFLPTMTIDWVKGSANVVADALTRCPFAKRESEDEAPEPWLAAVLAVWATDSTPAVTAATAAEIAAELKGHKVSFNNMKQLQRADEELRELIDFMKGKAPQDANRAANAAAITRHMALIDDVLYMTTGKPGANTSLQLAVPAGDLREHLLKGVHLPPLGTHQSATTIIARLSAHYWWPSMHTDVARMVRDCETCAKLHTPHLRYGEMQPLAVTERFQTWTVDFAGPWTKTDAGNQHLLVMQDNCTKICELIATPTTTAEAAADGILCGIVLRYGCPAKIVTDQGSAFASDLLAALCKSLNTQHAFSVAHHPQSHGQVERLIKTVERSIAATAAQHQRDWDRHLAGIQATLNFSPNRTTGVAPFELLTGAAPLLPAEQAIAPDAHRVQHTINDLAKSVRDRTADVARKTAPNVVAAQETQKRNHDERHLRPGPELDVGQYSTRQPN
jgi:transposase InsO family protein